MSFALDFYSPEFDWIVKKRLTIVDEINPNRRENLMNFIMRIYNYKDFLIRNWQFDLIVFEHIAQGTRTYCVSYNPSSLYANARQNSTNKPSIHWLLGFVLEFVLGFVFTKNLLYFFYFEFDSWALVMFCLHWLKMYNLETTLLTNWNNFINQLKLGYFPINQIELLLDKWV